MGHSCLQTNNFVLYLKGQSLDAVNETLALKARSCVTTLSLIVSLCYVMSCHIMSCLGNCVVSICDAAGPQYLILFS
jgi:hypothetical protein